MTAPLAKIPAVHQNAVVYPCTSACPAAIEVLRTAVELGVNHIDTADAYGPYITNEIIREAQFPYGDHVHIGTKVGVVRDEQGGWLPANSPHSLREQLHDNFANRADAAVLAATAEQHIAYVPYFPLG